MCHFVTLKNKMFQNVSVNCTALCFHTPRYPIKRPWRLASEELETTSIAGGYVEESRRHDTSLQSFSKTLKNFHPQNIASPSVHLAAFGQSALQCDHNCDAWA